MENKKINMLMGYINIVSHKKGNEDGFTIDNDMCVSLTGEPFSVLTEVDKEKLVARAVGRRICKSCGATYHIEFNPSKEEGVCDICKGELYQRADDNEETVSKRIQVYLDETKPLADYYSKKGIIADIDGQQSIDKVFNDIVTALESK